MMEAIDYNIPQRITLGLKADSCRMVMDEWIYRSAPCVLTIRKAKTKGMFCIVADITPNGNPEGLCFISWCIRNLTDRVQIDIKRL